MYYKPQKTVNWLANLSELSEGARRNSGTDTCDSICPGAKAQCANLVHRHQGKTNFYH